MTEATDETSDYETFAAREGAEFTMQTATGAAAGSLRLTAVRLTDGVTGSFTLDFHASTDVPGDQGTYLLRGRDTSVLPVFLVPSGRDSAGTRFHAVFNFLPPDSTKDGVRE